jgi:deoxycytidine triphosphate deaminase
MSNEKETESLEPKGVLTCDDIKKLALIDSETFDEKCLQNASYDLRLGDEYYVPKGQRDENIIIKKCSYENGVLRISPFSTIVFSTKETLKMPDNVIGRFDLRVRFAMQGLVLQVGTQIAPSYRGRLFGLLLNFSDKEICIPEGMELLSVEFSYTSKIAKEKPAGKPYESLKKFIESFPFTQGYGTLESFSQKMLGVQKEIETELKKIKDSQDKKFRDLITYTLAAIGIIFSVSIPFTVTHITKATIDKDDYPFKTIIQIEEENKILKNRKDSLELKVLELNNQLNYKNDSLKQEISNIRKQIQKLNNDKQNSHNK